MQTSSWLSRISEWIVGHAMVLLGFMVLITTLATRSQFLINWDAAQFALGTIHYSLIDHQPHPPGYFLFVKLGQLITLVTHDVNLSFIIIACTASLLAAYFLFRSIESFFSSRSLALGITLIFILNPLTWYYRSVSLTYTFEALAASLLLYMTIKAIRGKESLVPSVATVALLCGFRPSILIIATPFLMVQWFYSSKKGISFLQSFLLGGVITALWFIPFAMEVGGLSEVGSLVGGQFSATSADWSYKVRQMKVFLETAVFAINILLVIFAVRGSKSFSFLVSREGFLLATLPLSLMAMFYFFINFGEAGYFLSLLPLILFVAAAVMRTFNHVSLLIPLVLIVQLILFLGPTLPRLDRKVSDITYVSVRENDQRFNSVIAALGSYDPNRTLVLALRGEYFTPEKNIARYPDTIRSLQYYAPEHMIYDLVGVKNTYAETYRYTHTTKTSEKVMIPESVSQLIILVDYIHPEMLPKEFALAASSQTPLSGNIYTADLSMVTSFRFAGVTFERGR